MKPVKVWISFREIYRDRSHITEQITCNPLCRVGGKKFAPIPSSSLFNRNGFYFAIDARDWRVLFSSCVERNKLSEEGKRKELKSGSKRDFFRVWNNGTRRLTRIEWMILKDREDRWWLKRNGIVNCAVNRNRNLFNSGDKREILRGWMSFSNVTCKETFLFFLFSLFRPFSRDAKKKGRYEKKKAKCFFDVCVFLFRNIKAYDIETFFWKSKIFYFVRCVISAEKYQMIR